MGTALTTRIKVKDNEGRVVDEKEVATYAGLLAKAHEEGLSEVTTRLVQVPAPDNGDVAIVEATVTTGKGRFTGIGDAAPFNVGRKITPHLIRMAETRAKARALRDAVNIGMVALEELGGDEETLDPRPAPSRPATRPAPLRAVPGNRPATAHPAAGQPAPRAFPRGNANEPPRALARPEGREAPMTENQRRWLYRHLSERGFEGEAATDALCQAAEVEDVRAISKGLASQLIDAWKADGGADAA